MTEDGVSAGSVMDPDEPATLLVASPGGHLQELLFLRGRLEPPALRVEWVTHESEQSRSLLRGERVHFLPNIPPRGYAEAAWAFPAAVRMMSSNRFDRLVSTGAGVALPMIAAARTRRIDCHYIESAARTEGPSLTGRLVAPLPGVRTYTQHAAWSDARWLSRGSVFDGYAPVAKEPPRLRQVLVLLGTGAGFPFDRAVERLSRLLPRVLPTEARVVWQVGESSTGALPGEVYRLMPPDQMVSVLRHSDLVIAHAGVGSALTALEHGKCPVLLPRRRKYGEHVDDHQTLIAGELARRGLAVTADADTVSGDDLLRAGFAGVRKVVRPPRLVLA